MVKSSVKRVAARLGVEKRLGRAYRGFLQRRAAFTGARVRPENMVWVFGTGRSGSTWISRMMRDLRGYALWNEPLVGHMIGYMYHNRGSEIHHLDNFIFGGDEGRWLPPLRDYILNAATTKFPHLVGDPNAYLVVKEPHGSIGADLISRALPESRMVVLFRDPRDVTASKLDAKRPGSWAKKGNLYKRLGGDETAYVTARAGGYVRDMDYAMDAYRAHLGPKTTLRYEDVRAEPVRSLNRLLAELDLPPQPERVIRSVEKHDWSNVPASEKGQGKIRRKAKPGGWREDLTEEQIVAIENATSRYLDEVYPDRPRFSPAEKP